MVDRDESNKKNQAGGKDIVHCSVSALPEGCSNSTHGELRKLIDFSMSPFPI